MQGLRKEDISVYIVEDDENMRNLITSFLKKDGYPVSSFSSIESLKEAWNDSPPSVLIVDKLLPGENGDSFIRNASLGFTVPIIITASVVDDDYFADCIDSGALYVLQKPINMRTLLSVVDSAAYLHRALVLATQGLEQGELLLMNLGKLKECLNRRSTKGD